MTTTANRFNELLSNIALTNDQKEKGYERRDSVVQKLNQKYYSSLSKTENSIFVGSWGKYTQIRPPRDIDVLYELPVDVYHRYECRSGNKQSDLLQEIRDYLKGHYPNTDIKGNGPIVLVPFSNYITEIIPAFNLTNGRYYVCITKDGGFYKTADYNEEIKVVSNSNSTTKGNTRDLIRMLKRWQAYCNVPIKSFFLELLAIDFLNAWQYSGKSAVYYDWMIRDFLKYMLRRKNGNVLAPGTFEVMALGDSWVSKAESAETRAKKACEYEASNQFLLAGLEWQKIFGYEIPL